MKRDLRLALVAALATVCGSAFGAQQAHAQQIMVSSSVGPIGGGGGDRISKRSAEKYADILGLDQSQREVLDLLHQGYEDGVKAENDKQREKMRRLSQEFQESQDRSVWEDMPKIQQEHREKLKSMEASFLKDLRAMISDEQAEKWGKVERTRRREVGLNGGAVSGAGVDVVALVDGLKLGSSERAQFTQDLEQYEADLDRLIAEKIKSEEDSASKLGVGQVEIDMEAMSAMMAQSREIGMKIRDLNLNYSRKIEQLVPEAKRSEWNSAFKEASFPQVYRKSTTQRQLDAALKFDDLTSDQRSQLSQALESHNQAVSAINDRLSKAVMAEEENEQGGGMIIAGGQSMRMQFGEDDPDSETAKLRKEKRELDRRLTERMSSVLTKDQNDRLPTFSEGGQGGPGQLGGASFVIERGGGR